MPYDDFAAVAYRILCVERRGKYVPPFNLEGARP
jgi:hypothetical protein